MLPVQIIAQKRDGCELSDDVIAAFVRGYSNGQIPDYQMAAFSMAVFLNGMTSSETVALTQAMLASGERLFWPDDGILRVDKHSTGGIGDKVSLPLVPLLASCGFEVPMVSGRGLGPTGGTLDKLESIAGFRTNLSLDEIRKIVKQTGCVITGASAELAPADHRFYALRDVTATVPSIPLITASIMSKKLAESPDALVMDVKFGSGAFMKTRDEALNLARSLVQTGQRMNVATTALLTDMSQPLGVLCGNSVEVEESLDVLQGRGPSDVRELILELAAELLVTAGVCRCNQDGKQLTAQKLDDGSAMERFEMLVAAQSGDLGTRRPFAPAAEVTSEQSGIVSAIDTQAIGWSIIAMGGGRQKLSDQIDHSVGIEMLVRVGDTVTSGQPLMRMFTRNPDRFRPELRGSITLSDHASPPVLIADRIAGESI
ncbi:MAG: thymidine phosphorylase [Fuerstiella sp.]|nr:thymidine phosphorylase [Fuerstiella sp.]